ncbi:terpene cyclase [Steccherinum ochraceum]|uniref:Terpene synthase n=1 Tax=Steccherinum ochraceum TaxID=92696 RepID=A0A4R0RIH0_9APHY|nr:terpene cyclase [Steccherinum ochraceum]
MSAHPTTFTLPNLHALCPFTSSTNPHYLQASTESSAWISSFKVFSAEKLAFFKKSGAELLCSHVYHYTGYEQLRTCCDFVNLLFTIDEISDDQNAADATHTGHVFIEALRDPDFDDGSVLCQMTKQFRGRLAKMGPACYRRYLKNCEDYITAVGKEAHYREHGIVLDLESFQVLRRENSAVRTCFGLFGLTLDLDLPDEVANHEVMMKMHLAAVDMVCWSNDLYSYNMEQAMGHYTNNILTVLMKEKNIDLQSAADFVGEHFAALMDSFLADKARLPSWGPDLDAKVEKFIMASETWVVGNLNWSFETPRYFGSQREQVQKTLEVKLDSKRE